MSTRFHVNLATGEPGKCEAKHNCPFGSLDTDHFDSMSDARGAYEKIMESGNFAKLQKEQAAVVAFAKNNLLTSFDVPEKHHGARQGAAGYHGNYFKSVRAFEGNSAGKKLVSSLFGKSFGEFTNNARSRAAMATNYFEGKGASKRGLSPELAAGTEPANEFKAAETTDAFTAYQAVRAERAARTAQFAAMRADTSPARSMGSIIDSMTQAVNEDRAASTREALGARRGGRNPFAAGVQAMRG